MLGCMEGLVRIDSVSMHDRHGWADCAAMSPNKRVAQLVRMRDRIFAGQTDGLKRVARVRRLVHHLRPKIAPRPRG